MDTVTILVDRSRRAVCAWCRQPVTEPGCMTTGQTLTDGRAVMMHVVVDS